MNAVEKFKRDLQSMDTFQIFEKYLYTVHIWYFEIHRKLTGKDYSKAVDSFNSTIAKVFEVSQKEIHIVGSSKTGFSLAPDKGFSEFDWDDTNDSDIDVAIISTKHFNHIWSLIRNNTSMKYSNYYPKLASGIYNGFIPSIALKNIDDVRKMYRSKRDAANRELQKNLGIYRTINYRIYRSWQDLEDYHYKGIEKIKKIL